MGGELHGKRPGSGKPLRFDLVLPELSDFSWKKVASPPKITGYTGKRRTILVVNDRAENRNLLIDMPLPLDFRVVEAEQWTDLP